MKSEDLRVWITAPPSGKLGYAGQVRQLCRNDGMMCRISLKAQAALALAGLPTNSDPVPITAAMSKAAHAAGVPNKAYALLQPGSDPSENS